MLRLVVIMIAAVAALIGAPFARAADKPAVPVYAVYYRPEANGDARLSAILAANLIGRFGRAARLPIDAYRPGDLSHYAGAVVLTPRDPKAPTPQALADDAVQGRPVIWIDGGDGVLPRTHGRDLGLTIAPGPGPDPDAVIYKNERLTRDRRSPHIAFRFNVTAPALVLATAEGDGAPTPWAARSGRLIYLTDRPFDYISEQDRYLAYADLMFEAFAPRTAERHRAMVRIEDVGPDADPARLRRLADRLHARHVPFQVAVIDEYRDPFGYFNNGRKTVFTLAQRQNVVAALHYMVLRGATLIMHGHTHQADGFHNPLQGVSGGDYEFVRAVDAGAGVYDLKGPLPDDRTDRWRSRLDQGLAIWRKSRLPPPAAFTTPHYAATPAAYAAMGQRFPIRYERVIYFADDAHPFAAYTGQIFPYETVDVRGTVILPEDLGYFSRVDGEEAYHGGSEARLLAAARAERVVRDGFASFFFHWYEDPDALDRVVGGLQAMDYRFVSPGDVLADAPAHFPVHAAPALYDPAPARATAVQAAGPVAGGALLMVLVLQILRRRKKGDQDTVSP